MSTSKSGSSKKSSSSSSKHKRRQQVAVVIAAAADFVGYDPNKHCGVFVPDDGKPCMNSLACRVHSVSLRRQVKGRNGSFDSLLADQTVSNCIF